MDRYDENVSSYITKLVKNVRSQMKAHFVDQNDPISIIGFLATFKFACDANRIHEAEAMRVLPYYANETVASALQSRMCATNKSSSFAVSVPNVDNRSKKFLRLYQEVAYCVLNKFVTDQAIIEFDAAILRDMQLANMMPQQYADNLVARSCKVAEVSDEGAFYDVIIDGTDPSIRHSVRHYWAQNAQAD